MKFFATEETVTFELEPGYWVELKRGLDYGEESELEGAAVRLGVNLDQAAGTATPRVEYSVRDQRLLMLALYVVDWNLPGANGKAVALPDGLTRRQTVFGRLDPKVAATIVARIEALRAEGGAVDVISLEGLDGAEVDPTPRGDGTAIDSRSSSPNGSAAPTATSSALLVASSASPLR